MRGGEPVNKDVIDALKKVVASMQTNGEYPQLQKSLEELIRASENVPPTVNAHVNAPVNAASHTVNTDAATNEPKAELPESSVIHYGNNGKQTSTYLEIKKRLQKMIEKPKTMNPDNIPIETLKSRLEEITNAKTIPEVTAILQKYQFSDTYPQYRPAFLRFAMTGGGSRKHKMRKIKNQYTSK